jgi:predicted permease
VSLWRQIRRGLRVLTRRRAADQDVTDELRHYLDEAAAAFGAQGLQPDDARRAARQMVGNPTAIHEQVRDYGWENVVGTAVADLRFAGRMLRKSPVFTVVVIFVISLGSGAVTTIFSAMNALVLRPIPGVGDPDRLVAIEPVRSDGQILQQASYLHYAYLRDTSRTLDAVGAWGRVALTIAAGTEGSPVGGNMVSGNFFEILGISPVLGRFFAPEETRTPLSHPVIVVSHSFWSSRLGSDPAAIGRTLLVNGTPFTLIGVAPAEFHGIYTGLRADAWVSLMMQPLIRPRSNLTNASWLWLLGHLRDGSTIEAARHELAALATAQAIDAGEARGPAGYRSVRVLPLSGLPGGEGDGFLIGFISLLLGAASLVLLIAGVNVAAMLSARSVARRREFAVRAALGAGRTRLVRQLLTEILLLFLAGALGGIIFAVLATAALEQIPLPVNVPLMLELSPDFRVLAFALVISLTTGLIFGLTPALQAARQDITSRLRDDSPGSGSKRIFMNRALIVGQLALSMVLLVAAGLFMRALARGQQVNPGFDMTDVTTAAFEPESWGYDEARTRTFYRSLRERVAGLPGVTAVSYTGRLPLTAGSSVEDVSVEGGIVSLHNGKVDVDYFSVLRIPVLQGRALQSTDDRHSPPVAVVNETFARRGWPAGSAVGRTFQRNGQTITIVGIARDAKYATLGESTPPFAYLPVAQVWQPSQALIVRSAGHSDQLAAAIQAAALAIEPAAPRPTVVTMRQATSIVLLPQRVAAMVTAVLGAVGLLLATVGLYGIMAYSANRRTREIGIRVALGAQRSNVLRMMVVEGLRLAAVGIVIGLLFAAAVTPLMKSFLFSLNPLDVRTFAGMSLLFLAVALVASYLPARRAAASDPLAVLRAD